MFKASRAFKWISIAYLDKTSPYLSLGNLDASLQTLTRAKDLRSRLLKRVQVEQPDIVMEQKQLTAKVSPPRMPKLYVQALRN